MAGKMLAALGLVIAVGGVLLGNFVVMIFGGVVLALGQMLQGKARDQVNQRTFEGVAPDILGAMFQDIDQNHPIRSCCTRRIRTFRCRRTTIAMTVAISAERTRGKPSSSVR